MNKPVFSSWILIHICICIFSEKTLKLGIKWPTMDNNIIVNHVQNSFNQIRPSRQNGDHQVRRLAGAVARRVIASQENHRGHRHHSRGRQPLSSTTLVSWSSKSGNRPMFYSKACRRCRVNEITFNGGKCQWCILYVLACWSRGWHARLTILEGSVSGFDPGQGTYKEGLSDETKNRSPLYLSVYARAVIQQGFDAM
jgi:hypothetical protein